MNSNDLISSTGRWLDRRALQGSRHLARHTSRRGFLGKLTALILGAGALPLLPVSRSFAADTPDEMGDPQSCDYWRYCAISGTLCTCCGGNNTTCPPGSEVSPISWVGTCRNPVDDKEYLISYNDCCGNEYCERCSCHRIEGAKPNYFPSKTPNLLWCYGTESRSYTCTVAAVLGEASTD